MKKEILKDWILELLKAHTFPKKINENIQTGICAFRKVVELKDNIFYEFHFLYRKNGEKYSSVSTFKHTLADSFQFCSNRAESGSYIQVYNEAKLNDVCEKILECLNKPGDFKFISNGNDFDIIPMEE